MQLLGDKRGGNKKHRREQINRTALPVPDVGKSDQNLETSVISD